MAKHDSRAGRVKVRSTSPANAPGSRKRVSEQCCDTQVLGAWRRIIASEDTQILGGRHHDIPEDDQRMCVKVENILIYF